RRARVEPRRPRGDDLHGGRAARGAPALAGRRDGPVGLRRPAALPQRRRRARDRPRASRPPRPPARDRAGARPRPRRPALRAAHDRPRPPPLRRAGDPGARPDRAAPPAGRASVRPRAAFCPGCRDFRPGAWLRGGPHPGATIGGVSHLDELDDYEAELELRLKKEYSAVYSLFRFCVLTQDATYLCNKLDLQYVPQPSYPFFHVKMEGVWVWDKNRPRRMIPRVEVYTSADVTVEELRSEGDEPELTAEALAKRLSDRANDDDLS